MKNLLVRSASGTAWRCYFNFCATFSCLLLLAVSFSIKASPYPDLTGVFAGSAPIQDSLCTPTTLNRTVTTQLVVTFSNQVDNNFDVTVQDTSGGETGSSSGSGFFTSMTQFQFTVIDGPTTDQDSATVTANLSSDGSSFSFTLSGLNTGINGDGCHFNGSGTLNRSGGDLSNLNPATEASSTITGVALFNTELNNFFQSLGSHIGSSLRSGGSQGFAFNGNGLNYEGKIGMNAGDGGIPYGIWGNYTYTNFENDLSSTAFDGSSHSLLGGVDYSPIKNAILGVSIGYGMTDVDTTFNLGNQENDTFTIAPYFGMLINETWSVDASFGFSRVNTDQFRTAPGTTTQITSSPTADRWFGAVNLNGVTYINDWIIGGRVGVSRARNVTDSFVESNGIVVPKIINQLGTLSIGGDIAHSFGKYEPFVSLTYENDYRITKIAVVSGAQPSNDRDDFLLGIGVRYFGDNGLSGNLEWNKRLGRTNFEEDIFNFSLRADF